MSGGVSASDLDARAARDRERLPRTFGTDAERYDRVRPSYPAELFDELAELACIGSRLPDPGSPIYIYVKL